MTAPSPAPRRRKPKATIKYLTSEELERLFAVIKAARDKAIFRLAYHRGLRASEVGLLTMAHYRQAAERLYVTRLKNGNSGEYGLTAIEVKALRAWLKERGSRPGAIFLSKKKQAISQQMLDVLMKKYCRLAHIPPEKAHFHSLRHSCATSLLDRGRDIAEIKDHLGHCNIANTDIYARITSARRDRAANELRDWQ
ncbi:MAG: tyrosine-type recombinase/integrase [Streptosporangiaceae bacterium]|nr:tyrosine-type recombinase/integrase [Streptosporangiaceae bacterium]